MYLEANLVAYQSDRKAGESGSPNRQGSSAAEIRTGHSSSPLPLPKVDTIACYLWHYYSWQEGYFADNGNNYKISVLETLNPDSNLDSKAYRSLQLTEFISHDGVLASRDENNLLGHFSFFEIFSFLFFNFFFSLRQVAQVSPELLGLKFFPASVSWLAGTTSMCSPTLLLSVNLDGRY